MVDYKFDKAKMREDLNRNLHNETTTIYHILCKKSKERRVLETSVFLIYVIYQIGS